MPLQYLYIDNHIHVTRDDPCPDTGRQRVVVFDKKAQKVVAKSDRGYLEKTLVSAILYYKKRYEALLKAQK